MLGSKSFLVLSLQNSYLSNSSVTLKLALFLFHNNSFVEGHKVQVCDINVVLQISRALQITRVMTQSENIE